MKQTIEIDIPEGYKARYNQETQRIELVKNRSKDWEEFCKNHPTIKGEYKVKSDSYIGHIAGNDESIYRSVRYDRNLLASKEDAEGILALIQLTRLHDEWVGDWKANWECCESKVVILHTANEYVVRDGVYYHRLLVFPTREMAEEFKECFKDLLEKAKKFI